MSKFYLKKIPSTERGDVTKVLLIRKLSICLLTEINFTKAEPHTKLKVITMAT
jgi:hypothetical protein